MNKPRRLLDRTLPLLLAFHHLLHATAADPVTAVAGTSVQSKIPAGVSLTVVASTNIRRILFLGNSITIHGPKADIGWSGNWGMAASSEEKDYVHLVARAVAVHTGVTPAVQVLNIADFERNYTTFDVAGGLKDAFAFDPDLVVLAIGENVPGLSSESSKGEFRAGVQRILEVAMTKRHPLIVVRSCFWPDVAKDQILHEAADMVGATFVNIAAIGRDPANAARSERSFTHDGVAAHPGDKGMQAMADAIIRAIVK
jgi:hypothetical protein